MPLRRVLIPLSALLLLSAAVAAPDAPLSGNRCPPPPGMFSPEQRMMMMADAQKATADGSLSMEDYRSMQRDKIRAMTPDQRQAYFADLTKRWNALPPAEQAKLKAEAGKFREEHKDRPMGPPPGEHRRESANGDCPPPPPKD